MTDLTPFRHHENDKWQHTIRHRHCQGVVYANSCIPGMFSGKDAGKLKLPTKIIVWLPAQNLVTVPGIHIILRKFYAMGVSCMHGYRQWIALFPGRMPG